MPLVEIEQILNRGLVFLLEFCELSFAVVMVTKVCAIKSAIFGLFVGKQVLGINVPVMPAFPWHFAQVQDFAD